MTSHFSLSLEQASAKTKSKRTTSALQIILVFLFASNIYDTGGVLGLKYAAFFVAFVATVWTLKRFYLSPHVIAAGLLLFVAWPTWSLLYGAARGGDVPVGLSQVTPFLFSLVLTLILPACDNRLPLRLFYACLFSLAIVVIVSFTLVFLLPENSISHRVFETLTNFHEREGYFGTRALAEIDVPNIYFASTLFLVPAFVYYLFREKTLNAAVVLLAIGVSFSKAGISLALAFGAVYSILALFSRGASPPTAERPIMRAYVRRILPLVLLGGFVASCLVYVPEFAQEVRDAWAGESDTAIVRAGHIDSVLKLFSQHPHYLILGQGVGVPFFTSGESSQVQNIEVDHLNTIRKFGMPWFLAFSAVVFLSAWRLIKENSQEGRACGFALVSIYFAAGTNPVLTSPLFIILMILSYFSQRTEYGRPS